MTDVLSLQWLSLSKYKGENTVMSQEIAKEPFFLLKPGEVEKMLRISHRTLLRMIEDGQIPPPKRIGKRGKRWKEADIINFIETV